MVNILISCDPRYKVSKDAIQSAAITVLNAHRIKSRVELEVIIVGDRKMHELNRAYRGYDTTTDILTFAFEDPTPQNLQHIRSVGFVSYPDKWLRLGSIVISYQQAMEDAASDGKSVEEEVAYLVDHGTKHLLGIHHN